MEALQLTLEAENGATKAVTIPRPRNLGELEANIQRVLGLGAPGVQILHTLTPSSLHSHPAPGVAQCRWANMTRTSTKRSS